MCIFIHESLPNYLSSTKSLKAKPLIKHIYSEIKKHVLSIIICKKNFLRMIFLQAMILENIFSDIQHYNIT